MAVEELTADRNPDLAEPAGLEVAILHTDAVAALHTDEIAATGTPARLQIKRRLVVTGLLATFAISLLLAVPALRPVADEIGEISPGWLALAIALEVASCVSFVILFRFFFDRVPAADGRLLAWTSMASGALLPGGGVGGLAIGGWLMRLSGAPTAWIVRRSSAIFFLTTAVNAVAIIGSAALLLTGAGGPDDFLRAGLPLLIVTPATLAVAAVPRMARRDGRLRRNRWLAGIVEGISDAESSLAQHSWRELGAIGYLFFDIAVLWATFVAVGHAPPVPALIIGYTIGYAANALPVPAGIGVLDAGLAGALVLYGASPVHAAAAVLVYHAIAFWIPSLGGVIAYSRLGLRMSSKAAAPIAAAPILTDEPAQLGPAVSLNTWLPSTGGLDDDTGPADQTDARRLGRVPDRRPGACALSGDDRAMARVPLPTARRLRNRAQLTLDGDPPVRLENDGDFDG